MSRPPNTLPAIVGQLSRPRHAHWVWWCFLSIGLLACAPAHHPEPPPSTTVTDNSSSPNTPATTVASALPPRGTSAFYSEREDAMAWADSVASRTQLPREWIRNQVAQARRQAAVIRAVTPTPGGTEKNWATYRARFVEPLRTQAGLAFWHQHALTLARAEQQFGVPAALIVGIMGVETFFGKHLGQHRVLDALATLAFDFPTAHPREPVRSAFFQQELLEFLLLAREQDQDPTSFRGSYAGAMGWPQFLASSWRRYAIDFDRDGRIDLINNPVDVIGSVANYFVAFGWKPGMPTHYPVEVMASPKDLGELLAPDIVPTFDVNSFVAKGGRVSGDALKHPGPLALVRLENGFAPPSYIAGTQNFYVVTRYNWSSYYALAVIELGEHIQAQRARSSQVAAPNKSKKNKPAKAQKLRPKPAAQSTRSR